MPEEPLSVDRATAPSNRTPHEALAAAEEQVRLKGSVVEQGFSAVLIADADLPDPTIVYINPAFERATGYTAEVVGHRLSTLSAFATIHARLRTGVPADQNFIEETGEYETPTGQRWGEWRVGPVRDQSGRVTHWLLIFRDVTARKRLEREILEISEQERRRIGQDLHDGLCQQLAGIELMSQVLGQSLESRHKSAAAQAAEIARHVREAISQTRLLARGLSPVTLESEGLMSALQELAVNTEKLFSVGCRLECSQAVHVTDLSKATHLYRVAQEAVSNAIKHGKATEIRIHLSLLGDAVELMICDNGAGFGPEPGNKGMGLRIMQYRASVIGGKISITSNTPHGVIVTCLAPISRPS